MILSLLLAAVSRYDCPPDDLTATPRLYEVVGNGPLPFVRFADCAKASCREGVYVVPGDRVVVFFERAGKSCVLFQRRRETTGWVASNRLRPVMTAEHPTLTGWAAEWYDGDDHIRLAVDGVRLRVTGDAYYPSAHPSDNMPNVGELDGQAVVHGNRADYAHGSSPEDACRATFRLLGDLLLVNDNENCGGQNVRFRGVYRHR